ncbi:MAG: hypothetical protein HYY24_07545 [Verrucomicrobia bacterium]|nr:hypothetical protein [Verrucomicrobiota bacterium]
MNSPTLSTAPCAGLRQTTFLSLALLAVLAAGCATAQRPGHSALRQALTFYASFDGGTDADFAAGDRRLYSAASMKHPRVGTPGLPAGGHVTLAQGQGRFGDALRFHKKSAEMVFFKAEQNVAYRPNNWNGTVSLWLRVDPATELAPSFCDPIQITPRDWNDAAFFVEFEKRPESIPFRLGAYADLKVWNPQNRDWGAIPFAEKPLVHIEKPPFGGARWTHVVFTWQHFNTGQPDGVATLYLDGQLAGALSPRVQTFTWDPAQTLVMLGLSYIGLWDELAIFDRALSPQDVQALYELEGGVRALLK